MQLLVPFEEAAELLTASNGSYTDCLACFLVLLNIDIELKKLLCTGIPEACIAPLCTFKAPNIFLTLSENVVLPWMRCEFRSTLDLVDEARNYYCLS